MFDYVIVGAGSAGCVLANRLSADPGARVLLLEAGPRDRHPFIHMPAGIAKLVNLRRLNWDFNTEAEAALQGRRLWWPRGRVLGGSSSINAMCYIRGVARDYDDWAAAGATGWAWQDVLPAFRRSETNTRGASALHGDDGPLHVADLRHVNPLSRVFIDAGMQMGLPRNDDFNGPTPDSISCCGELIAPPRSTTSRSALAFSTRPRSTYSTPTARLPSNSTRVTSTPVRTVRFGRASAGRR
jgi:choline dehydrogenase